MNLNKNKDFQAENKGFGENVENKGIKYFKSLLLLCPQIAR